jgi:hypothetical protein
MIDMEVNLHEPYAIAPMIAPGRAFGIPFGFAHAALIERLRRTAGKSAHRPLVRCHKRWFLMRYLSSVTDTSELVLGLKTAWIEKRSIRS